DVYQYGYTYYPCCVKEPDRPAGRSMGSVDSRRYFNYNSSVYHVLLRAETFSRRLNSRSCKRLKEEKLLCSMRRKQTNCGLKYLKVYMPGSQDIRVGLCPA